VLNWSLVFGGFLANRLLVPSEKWSTRHFWFRARLSVSTNLIHAAPGLREAGSLNGGYRVASSLLIRHRR